MALPVNKFVDLLSDLTIQEKIKLLSGCDFSTIAGVERLAIPPIRVADSVSGIRPSGLDASLTTVSFPNTACYGTTWDAELLGRLGEELARQARLKGAQVVLGPTINIHRDPRAGRNFECFSEDPLLSGQLAGAIVNGVQKGGVGSCPKHFVANDAETLRHFYDVQEKADGRTLREIYLAAWQHLLRTSDPEGIMTAYNKVDGVYCSAHSELIQEILRGEWGYRGFTMSDWFAVKDTVGPLKAGLDVEMPFPVFRGDRLNASLEAGVVNEAEIDARVSKMLELRDRTKACHGEHCERSEITTAANDLAREIGYGGMVLLKNEKAVLPISNTAKVALIGEFAHDTVFTGGGSASCEPQYRDSPLEVLKKEYQHMEFTLGVRTRRIIPLAPKENLRARDGQPGVDILFYNNDQPNEAFLAERSETASVWMLGQFRPGLKVPGSHIRLSTTLTPSTTGLHTLAVRCTGAFTISVDGKQIAMGPATQISTEQFIFNHILLETRVEVSMQANTSYAIEVVMQSPSALTVGEPTPYALLLAFEEAYSEEKAIEEASNIARDADVSVIYAGRNSQYESEGFDLDTIELPANQVRLIRAVTAASKATVLILHAGNPIDVSAVIEDVDAVLLAHFPGQEGARAVAELLTGRVCPSGKLATTWWKTLEDAPSFAYFPPKLVEDQSVAVKYAEGLRVGYRATGLTERIRWPFGFGLSYTTFRYSDLQVKVDENATPAIISCSVSVHNTGTVAGREVVQLYVRPPSASDTGSGWRPPKELKAFTKLSLMQPNESCQATLEVDLHMACSYWVEERKSWRCAPGLYTVTIGECEDRFQVLQEYYWNHL